VRSDNSKERRNNVDVGVAIILGLLAWIFVFGGLGAWVAAQKYRSVN
jgi:hypothetical protein